MSTRHRAAAHDTWASGCVHSSRKMPDCSSSTAISAPCSSTPHALKGGGLRGVLLRGV